MGESKETLLGPAHNSDLPPEQRNILLYQAVVAIAPETARPWKEGHFGTSTPLFHVENARRQKNATWP